MQPLRSAERGCLGPVGEGAGTQQSRLPRACSAWCLQASRVLSWTWSRVSERARDLPKAAQLCQHLSGVAG